MSLLDLFTKQSPTEWLTKQLTPKSSGMRFNVGEGLNQPQAKQAQQTVRKPVTQVAPNPFDNIKNWVIKSITPPVEDFAKIGKVIQEPVEGYLNERVSATKQNLGKIQNAITSLPQKAMSLPQTKNPIDALFKTGEMVKKELSAPMAMPDKEELFNTGMGFLGGGMKNVAKEGLDDVGRAILKNISKNKITKPLNVLDDIAKKSNPLIQEAKIFNPEKYVAEQVTKQSAARKSETLGIAGKTKDFLKNIKVKLVDSNAPIEDVISDFQRNTKSEILPKYDITNQIDRVYRAPTIAGQFMEDNGLESVIKNVDNIDNIDQYLIAKQAKTVAANGIETGRDLTKDQKLIDAFAPRYEETAQKVNQYSKNLLDYSVDAGLIDKKIAADLKIKYPDYAPINRVFSELEKTGEFSGPKGVASLSKQTVVQGLKGSEREIESPIASLMAKTNDAFVQGEKNKAAKILTDYAKLPNNPFELRLLKTGEIAVKGRGTISVLNNGVKEIYETTPEIAQAAKSLSVQQLNILGKIFALPVRVARVGITGINLPFVASNIAKDQVTAIINSKNALKTSIANPLNFLKALYNAVGHGKLYQEAVRSGAMGTSFDISRNQAPKTIAKIRASRNIGSRILYTVKNPGELLRSVENIVGRSEELTRLQQYGATKQAMLKKGMTESDAIISASKAARENTVNFARRGEWGTVLNSTFLYLNAGIQGTRTFLRGMKTRPVQTTTKLALTVFAPIATVTLWNLNDPKRKAAYEDIAEYEKESNIVIIPPNPTQDENGNWNVIKIPLSQEVNNIASLARRPIEQSFGLDPVRAGEVAQAFLGTVLPINMNKDVTSTVANTFTPQVIKPTLEMFANKNFFTGFKQVPASMENLSPKMQIKENTSGTAIKIGDALNLSPIQVEAFIKGTAGGVATQGLNASDRILAGLKIIPEDQIGGQDTIEAIMARFNTARGGQTDEKSNNKLKEILTDQADERFRVKQEAEILFEEFKKMPKEEANVKSSEIKKTNPELFQKLKDTVEADKKGLDYNERLILQLGVENGERAKFVWENLKAFKTKDEKNNYVNEMKKKGIISEKVFKQLGELKSKGY